MKMLKGRKESEKDQGKALFSLVSPLAVSLSPFQVCDYFCTLTLSLFNIPTHKLYSFWYTPRVGILHRAQEHLQAPGWWGAPSQVPKPHSLNLIPSKSSALKVKQTHKGVMPVPVHTCTCLLPGQPCSQGVQISPPLIAVTCHYLPLWHVLGAAEESRG